MIFFECAGGDLRLSRCVSKGSYLIVTWEVKNRHVAIFSPMEASNKTSEEWNETSEEWNETSEEMFRTSVENFSFLGGESELSTWRSELSAHLYEGSLNIKMRKCKLTSSNSEASLLICRWYVIIFSVPLPPNCLLSFWGQMLPRVLRPGSSVSHGVSVHESALRNLMFY